MVKVAAIGVQADCGELAKILFKLMSVVAELLLAFIN
jgi:hypothetical protein